MFRKLRLRLTFINVVVVVVITAFFMAGIYVMMIDSMRRQSDQLMGLIASDVGSSAQTNNSRHQRRWFNFFYVKLDDSGRIFETSQNLPVSRDELSSLVTEARNTPNQRGIAGRDEQDQLYRFLKAPLNNNPGTTIVFLNIESEEEVIGHLIGAFTVTGLAGAALALLGSLFMANRALIPIKKSWEHQKNFVADASHELRTPIAVIQTNLDIVKNNPDEKVETQLNWLENIQAENQLMAKLVDDLLLLARADSDQLSTHMKEFNLNLAVEQALSPFRPVAAQKEIQVTENLDSEIYFVGDSMRITQLTAILIDNAIKYTPEGGAIGIKLKDGPQNVQIIVEDSGVGIEKKYHDKIFERFFRVDTARSRETGGVGLGLAIAGWVVKEHRGTIKVDSSGDRGTTFTVVLPKLKT